MSHDTHAGPTRRALRRVRRGLRKVKFGVERRFGLFDPLVLLAYRSEGTPELLRVRGRVVERTGVEKPDEGGSVFRNILNTFHRLESDEIPGARVIARYRGVEARDETDAEGYFEMELRPGEGVEAGWHDVELEILGSMAGGAGVATTAEVLVPSPEAEFVVVSNLDDTVIRSHATETWTRIRTVFAQSASSRSTMPGAAPLYSALEGGPDGDGSNPFFYVSRSGWGAPRAARSGRRAAYPSSVRAPSFSRSSISWYSKWNTAARMRHSSSKWTRSTPSRARSAPAPSSARHSSMRSRRRSGMKRGAVVAGSLMVPGSRTQRRASSPTLRTERLLGWWVG